MAAIHGDWYASRSTHDGEAYLQSDGTVRFVYSTHCYDLAVEYALHAHGPAFGLRLESVETGVPPADCGYYWNDARPQWRKKEVGA